MDIDVTSDQYAELNAAIEAARVWRANAQAEIKALRAAQRKQEPEGQREEQVAEWLRSRGWVVKPPLKKAEAQRRRG